MSFISKLRGSIASKPKRDVRDVLAPYSMYNFNDVLNDVYIVDDLREKGDSEGAKQAYQSFVDHGAKLYATNSDVGVFFKYLLDKSAIDQTIKSVNAQAVKSKNVNDSGVDKKGNIVLTDREKLVSAIIIEESRHHGDEVEGLETLSYDALCKYLDISHGRDVELSTEEYSNLSQMSSITQTNTYKSITRKLVSQYPIPDVSVVDDIYETNDLSDLYDEYLKDDYFKDRFKIKNIYAIENNKQSANAHKQGENVITLNSGTSNESLVKILHGGFKKPSQLAHEAGVQMAGQMFGDAVYFARPDQISKNTAYVDRYNAGSKFIIVADIYYDKKIDHNGNYGKQYRYNGDTLVHAHGIGRFDRDEYMVAPEQVAIKYVLEVTDGHLTKPKQKTNDKNDTVDLDLDLSGLATDLQK